MVRWLPQSLGRTNPGGHGAMCAPLSRTHRDMSGRSRGDLRRERNCRRLCGACSSWRDSWLQAGIMTTAVGHSMATAAPGAVAARAPRARSTSALPDGMLRNFGIGISFSVSAVSIRTIGFMYSRSSVASTIRIKIKVLPFRFASLLSNAIVSCSLCSLRSPHTLH